MTKEKVPSARDYRFRDGPRKGTFLRLGTPPWRYLKLTAPGGGMCSYEYDPADVTYFQVDDRPSSKE